MALTAADIERVCGNVAQGSEREMLEALADAVVDHLLTGTAGEWDEQALLQLAEDWPAKADEIMAGYSARIDAEVRTEVSQALTGSMLAEVALAAAAYAAMGRGRARAQADAYRAAETAYRRSTDKARMARLQAKAEQRAAEAAQRAAQAVRQLNLGMRQQSAQVFRGAMKDAVEQWVVNAKTRASIVEGAVLALGDAFRVRYASGAKTTVDVAINRALTTELSQTDGENTLAAMRELGCPLGITDAHYGARPSHAVWQGRPFGVDGEVVMDGVRYPSMAELTGYGTAGGLKGVNCRHSVNPYWPGITELPDTEFQEDRAKHNGMTSDEYYAATQRQRAYERAIRRSKASIAQMERAGIGLESPAYVQKRLELGNRQRQLRSLCDTNGMTRQPARERAYGVKSQPRALSGTGWKARYGVRESLVPKATEKGNLYDVNRKVVNSKKYHDKYESLEYPKAVRESLYRNAGRILAERNGTGCERFVVVNAKTGDLVADTFGYEPTPHGARLKPAEAKRASECADGVVTVHNHPASVYPSFADIRMTLGIANVRGSIVACHDGDVYLIEADRPGADMEKRYWEIYTEKRKELIDRTRAANAAFGQLEAENEVRKWFKITKL